jgi:hypothetical protein
MACPVFYIVSDSVLYGVMISVSWVAHSTSPAGSPTKLQQDLAFCSVIVEAVIETHVKAFDQDSPACTAPLEISRAGAGSNFERLTADQMPAATAVHPQLKYG